MVRFTTRDQPNRVNERLELGDLVVNKTVWVGVGMVMRREPGYINNVYVSWPVDNTHYHQESEHNLRLATDEDVALNVLAQNSYLAH